MRVQVVCLANSKVEKGRILIGILMENGAPVLDEAGPHWVHLVVDPKRSTVPTGLIVDILPMDLIEVDLPGLEVREHCKGTVVFDPYSLRFVGTLSEAQLLSCRHAYPRQANPAGRPSTIGSFKLLEAKKCKVACEDDRPLKGIQLADLHFESDGRLHRFPIRDPWFLEALQLDPHILDKKPAHYVLVSEQLAARAGRAKGNVMTILF